MNDIVKENAGLIYKIASYFYGVSKEDLFQAGTLGLLKAYKNYDGMSSKFSSYAYNYIYGEMYNLVLSNNLKVGRDTLKLYKLIDKTKKMIESDTGKPPSYEQLSKILNISESDIYEVEVATNKIMSIESDDFRYDHIPSKDKDADLSILLSQAQDNLTNKEKEIINLRYYEDLSQIETAKKLGISQVTVSRYEEKSLKKMKKFISS